MISKYQFKSSVIGSRIYVEIIKSHLNSSVIQSVVCKTYIKSTVIQNKSFWKSLLKKGISEDFEPFLT